MITTKIVGIIGNPLAHSLSPYIHNACFKKLSMDWQYIPFEIEKDDLGKLIELSKRSNIAGFNVTMPYKESVFKYLDSVEPEVEKIQAVNTIKIDGGTAIGFNTDAHAISKTIQDYYGSLTGKKVLIIGAGGVAKAAAYSAMSLGCDEIRVLNRSSESVGKLLDVFQGEIELSHVEPGRLTDILKSTDIIINATPVGMYPKENEVPLDANCLKEGQFVLDLIYHPAETKLLRDAIKRGLRVAGGVPVFIYQAAESFKIWTGLEPPVELMVKVIEEKLGER